MDFVKIKNMVRENGDKVIIMENGEPELVVMSFAEYEKLARLRVKEMVNSRNETAASRYTEPMSREPDEEAMRETEFVAPLGIEAMQTARIPHNNAAGVAPVSRNDSPRLQDIRLEDLPI